jgi:hypothetical protein
MINVCIGHTVIRPTLISTCQRLLSALSRLELDISNVGPDNDVVWDSTYATEPYLI